MNISPRVFELRETLSSHLLKKHWRMSTAESCTGGLVAATLTDLAGSSRWFQGGHVTYANEAKMDLLGVSSVDLERFGAVSEEVARAMAQGSLATLHTDLALAITGVAGPGGGSAEKPVGTVWIGWASGERVLSHCFHFQGDRDAVREQALESALEGALCLLGERTLPWTVER